MLDVAIYRKEIVGQAAGFAELLSGADTTLTVPTCPEWTLADLAAHVGAAHRWSAEIVRRAATEMVPFTEISDTAAPADPVDLPEWIRSGAAALERAVVDPQATVWSPVGMGPAGYWLRRMALETAMHRVDAAGTVGTPFQPGTSIAEDGIDEWVGLLSSPTAAHVPAFQPLRGNGERLAFHAQDTGSCWYVERTPDGVQPARPGPADVTVTAPAGELVLVLARRADPSTVTVSGDAALFTHWITHTAF